MELYEICVFSQVPLDQELVDVRPRTTGCKFGIVKAICKQYGIRYHDSGHYTKFIGRKSQIQKLVETFHFSNTPYSFQS